MGQTSSQLPAPTHPDEAVSPRAKREDGRAGSAAGSETKIKDSQPISVTRTPLHESPQFETKRKRDDEEIGVEAVVQKKRKKIKKAQGRPRDPSLLKKSVVRTTNSLAADEQDRSGTNVKSTQSPAEEPLAEKAGAVEILEPTTVNNDDLRPAPEPVRELDGQLDENDPGPAISESRNHCKLQLSESTPKIHTNGPLASPIGRSGPRRRRKSAVQAVWGADHDHVKPGNHEPTPSARTQSIPDSQVHHVAQVMSENDRDEDLNNVHPHTGPNQMQIDNDLLQKHQQHIDASLTAREEVHRALEIEDSMPPQSGEAHNLEFIADSQPVHHAEDPNDIDMHNAQSEQVPHATADQVVAELATLLEELPRLTKEHCPDDAKRQSLRRLTHMLIGDYIDTWTAKDDEVSIAELWEHVAKAWPQRPGKPLSGKSLRRVYWKKHRHTDDDYPINRTVQGQGDTMATQIRAEVLTPTPVNPPTRRANQAQTTGARGAQENTDGMANPLQVAVPVLTPPETTVGDAVLERASGTFDENIRGVVGWVEMADENTDDPNIASPRRERAQKMAEKEDDSPPARLNIGRTLPVSLPDPLVAGPARGHFTDAEKAAADDVFDYICQSSRQDVFKMRAMTIDWRNVNPELKSELAAALPNRNVRAIRKFSQRRYRPRKQGNFDKEEDDQLMRAVAEYGEKWEEVADLLAERTAEQCRDRHRHILKYGDDRTIGPWSQGEETMLIKTVLEIIEQIKDTNIQNGDLVNDNENFQKLINWETVCTKFGARRSKKKCREKWAQLTARNSGLIPDLSLVQHASTTEPVEYNANSSKQRAMSKKYELFKIGDVYDVLVEILTALDDHEKVYEHESTVWSLVAMKHNKQSRFSSPLRRKAYQEALIIYGLKKRVAARETIAGKAAAMVKYLDGYAARKGVEVFERGYMVENTKSKDGFAAPPAVKTKPVGTDGTDVPVAQPAHPVTQLRALSQTRAVPQAGAEPQSRTTTQSGAVLQDHAAPLTRSVALPRPGSSRRLKFRSAEKIENSDEEAEAGELNMKAVRSKTSVAKRENNNGEGIADTIDSSQGPVIPSCSPPPYELAVTNVVKEQDTRMANAQLDREALDDAVSPSSLDAKRSHTGGRTSLANSAFMERCRSAGRRQHEEVVAAGRTGRASLEGEGGWKW
ncbi:hypothetical protein LTR62_002404 [Meristemomyces frigidus]|uniref:Uncharacterized protein n=1 Tax=Meristemomyces frigidus TaxID=1508187 RepID=A0AAN7YHM8_9PEZI|nr:hypothetical protein LTR62_002404 [Meristemomyces frigidus]